MSLQEVLRERLKQSTNSKTHNEKMALTAYKIIASNVIDEDMSIRKLAKQMGMCNALLGNYFRGKSKWPSDCWLKTLYNLGYLEIDEDKLTIYHALGKQDVSEIIKSLSVHKD